MQGAVAVAGPFFSVHMLRNLGFSYAEFMANLAASIVMQLLTLNAWGAISDHLGNRIVLVATALLIPTLPLLWIFPATSGTCSRCRAWPVSPGVASPEFVELSLRPAPARQRARDLRRGAGRHRRARAVFGGAMLGGALAAQLPATLDLGGMQIGFEETLYGVFLVSTLLRLAVALWFTPHVAEIRLSQNATVNQVIYRLARFNPVTGVVMDMIGAVRKRK